MSTSKIEQDINRLGVLYEAMHDDIKGMLEVVLAMRNELETVQKTVADVPQIKQDTQTIKTALKATNQDLHNHEVRMTRLETQAASFS